MARMAATTLLLALVLACSLGCRAEQDVPDCSSAVLSLVACEAYVTGNAVVPGDSCCSAVSSIYNTNPICLCEMLLPGGAASLLPGFRPDLADKMPALCQVNGANPALCSALINGTTPAPNAAPTAPAPAPGNGASSYVPAAFAYFVIAAVAALFKVGA